ncbi:MAG TPA: sigma-70 family RNA polymerase sigma factor [Candidatus Polarisedimenticolaceae bacterium]|nr:sigma-70 family RNA polymerase sigma factor [Candidatus Polarisedimenticolaceae bacterium]
MSGGSVVDPEGAMLVREILSGSTTAFEALMRRYRRLVYRIAFGLTHDVDTAMEITQETFLKVHERLRDWRGDGDVKNWIARIAANEALNFKRSVRRREAGELLLAGTATAEPSQHAALVRRENEQALHRSLDALPPRQRLAVVLRYFQGMSAREIGALLDCSEETARNTLLRSLRRLRHVLAGSAGAEPRWKKEALS